MQFSIRKIPGNLLLKERNNRFIKYLEIRLGDLPCSLKGGRLVFSWRNLFALFSDNALTDFCVARTLQSCLYIFRRCHAVRCGRDGPDCPTRLRNGGSGRFWQCIVRKRAIAQLKAAEIQEKAQKCAPVSGPIFSSAALVPH